MKWNEWKAFSSWITQKVKKISEFPNQSWIHDLPEYQLDTLINHWAMEDSGEKLYFITYLFLVLCQV